MKSSPSIGFVGFGEAGFHIAKGLRSAGVGTISAYDINTHTPGLGHKIGRRAKEAEVPLVESSAQLASRSEVVFSTVTADRAMEAAEQTAPFLSSHHLYADLNSVSPALKQTIAGRITESGARFIEAAVMSPVAPHSHRVPIFLGGPDARSFVDMMSPFAMKLEVVSERIGVASATKMCRSIVVKGLEALMLECVLAAVPYGADERVFATLNESFPGLDWKRLASYMVGRVAEHGERRAQEMKEVSATLRSLGIEPMMADATARRQAWWGAMNLLRESDGEAPTDYQTVVRAIREKLANDE